MEVSDSPYVLNVIGTIMVVIDFEEVISDTTLYANCFIKIPLGSGEVILPFVKELLFGPRQIRKDNNCAGYLILSAESGKFYAGNSTKVWKRLGTHRHLLRESTHYCESLQKEFLEVGYEVYFAIVIGAIDQRQAQDIEQFFIEYGSNFDRGFNPPVVSVRFKDLTDKQFNDWTVISRAPNAGTATCWYCRCVCGVERPVQAAHLVSSASKSCGCRPANIKTHGETRGGVLKKKYRTWRYIRNRCLNPDNKDADIYFGLLCDEWLVYENFDRDVPDPPDDSYSIDRIKNELGYQPGNVRWVTMAEQHRNQTNNRWIEFNGRTQLLTDWAKELGITDSSLHRRIARHGVELALTTPPGTNIAPAHNRLLIEKDGIVDSVKGWAKRLGISVDAVHYKLRKYGKL
jgi:hypothetical protein